MQKLRNAVLNEQFESELNQKLLESKHGRWQLRVDKTDFCEHYESQLLQQSKLTKHQMDKFEEIQREKSPRIHVKANAGSGKTFLAVNLVIETLKETEETKGQILFIAPALQLCFYFVRWLGRRGKQEKLPLTELLQRIVIRTPNRNFLKLAVEGRGLVATPALCSTEFALTVVDEAHDIYRDEILDSGFLEKVKTDRWLLLSNLSQSSDLTPKFPENMTEVRLTEVVRCTKRIVAGAAAFHGTPEDKEELASLCPDGPPLKTFLFEATDATSGESDYATYVEQSVAAIRYIVHGYPGLSLHHRLALLVSDDHFRQEFEPKLEAALKIGERKFGFTTFQDSMSALPLDLLEDLGSEDTDDREMIILDTVDHAKGLEQLLVICIDLDSEIGSGSETPATTRARIYQGLTRAQLQAVVVNKLVKDGWLEFIGLIDPKVRRFEENAAMEETTAKAAFKITSETMPKENSNAEPKGEPKEKPKARQEQQKGHGQDQRQKHQGKQSEEERPEQGSADVAKHVSSVWDTSENQITAIENPKFNPFPKAGWKHDAGMSNFSVVVVRVHGVTGRSRGELTSPKTHFGPMFLFNFRVNLDQYHILREPCRRVHFLKEFATRLVFSFLPHGWFVAFCNHHCW